MKKIDFKKELKSLYKPSHKEVVFIDVPKMNFLQIDGRGNPNTSEEFANATQALFSVSYALKFMVKKGEMAIDYGVMPLEGLWWVDDMRLFDVDKKDEWKWTIMIMQPEFITKAMVDEAIQTVKIKKNPVSLPLLRFKSFKEGKTAQILHRGPFTEEGPTIDKVHQAIFDKGGTLTGRHHEIYLSDIRKAAPENWKTVIRQAYK